MRRGAKLVGAETRPRLIANPSKEMGGVILQINQALIQSFAKAMPSFCIGRTPAEMLTHMEQLASTIPNCTAITLDGSGFDST